jgi:CHAT domain-containing protein
MERFYGALRGPGRPSPAAALARAQASMAREPRWRAPYYWAGFVLQGEWR